MKKQKIYLEHANISVSSLEKSLHFFKTAFPTFTVRGGDEKKWLHFGDDYSYVALTQGNPSEEKSDGPNYDEIGLSHLGFVVGDVKAVSANLLAAGYKRNFPTTLEKYRCREYFLDNDGNEYEFVEYFSDIITERNSYDAVI